MKITLEWLKEKSACKNGIDWCVENKLIGLGGKEFTQKLVDAEQFDWAYWLVKKVLSVKQSRMMAVFAAEQVLDIFEKKYPDDKRPRNAIEAARKVIENDTEKNRNAAAYATADDAYAAAYATADASYAAYAASYAAYAAADAAAAASYAAYAASYAAYAAAAAAADASYAAYDAAYAAYAARKEIKIRILTYAISLLEKGGNRV